MPRSACRSIYEARKAYLGKLFCMNGCTGDHAALLTQWHPMPWIGSGTAQVLQKFTQVNFFEDAIYCRVVH